MIPQVSTRSRSKHRIVNAMKSNSGDLSTLSRNSWPKRDLSLGRHNHGETKNQILGSKQQRKHLQYITKTALTRLPRRRRVQQLAVHLARITVIFKAKCHRSEPEFQDSKEQEHQGSPERKRRSAVSRTSSIISSYCAYHVCSHVTSDFVVPEVHHNAASEVNNSQTVDFCWFPLISVKPQVISPRHRWSGVHITLSKMFTPQRVVQLTRLCQHTVGSKHPVRG